NSFFTTIITQKLPYKATDFTPVANLALDPFFLWVNDDSPWKTAQDFITAAKENSLTVAGTGAKQEDEALFRRIEDTMKTKPFTYLSQTSGATVAAAVAGHQGGVVASVNNPSEGLALYQANPRSLDRRAPSMRRGRPTPSNGPLRHARPEAFRSEHSSI